MEQSKTCVHVYKAQATCILLNDWGRGLCLPNQGTSPKPKQIMPLKKIGHWMIALEIIHFYLNVLISKSVIILTLASQGHIFLSPVPCMHGG